MSTHRPDYLRERGSAALGARLRRLSERIDREATQIYRAADAGFEQRWYGPLNQIRLHDRISVGDIAARLRISHAAVSQTVKGMLRAGLLESHDVPGDGRRRELSLSRKGKALCKQLGPTWLALEAASSELDCAAGGMVAMLDRLEAELTSEPLAVRFARLKRQNSP